MLGIVEIGLTIVAWRRGWRAWALLPLGGVFSLGLVVGIVAGVMGASPESVFMLMLPLDFLTVGVLIWMVARPRNRAVEPAPVEQLPERTTAREDERLAA